MVRSSTDRSFDQCNGHRHVQLSAARSSLARQPCTMLALTPCVIATLATDARPIALNQDLRVQLRPTPRARIPTAWFSVPIVSSHSLT
jgi:hypothetical protein